jgi:hypothetical protein
VFDPDTQIERTVELVWPGEESYPKRISVLTAFGSALIGLSEGHRVIQFSLLSLNFYSFQWLPAIGRIRPRG